MKLIIQIPCFDEEEQLPGTLADLPRELPGVDEVEWLVIDDGSTDRTSEAARSNPVDPTARLPTSKGKKEAFQALVFHEPDDGVHSVGAGQLGGSLGRTVG